MLRLAFTPSSEEELHSEYLVPREFGVSATYTRSAFRMRGGVLRLAKATAPLGFVWTWPGIDVASLDPTSVTVSRDAAGRWFVVLHVDVPAPEPLPATGQAVGVDVGLKDFAVLSTGQKIPHPRHMERRERRLKRYQRRLARCQRGSQDRARARVKVARQYARVTTHAATSCTRPALIWSAGST